MKRVAAALALSVSLSACQTLQAPPVPASTPSAEAQALWSARLQQLSAIDHFSLRGRIASGGLGGGSADLSWNQGADHFVVMLSGALGIGALRIEGTAENLTITTRDGQYSADEAQEALKEKLGAPLPVAELRFWVLGLPRPDVPATTELDTQGRLLHLQQEGWRLDYLEYRDAPDQHTVLPHKLWLSRGSDRWKLVIDQWGTAS